MSTYQKRMVCISTPSGFAETVMSNTKVSKKITHHLDVLGFYCPVPLHEMKKGLDPVQMKKVLTLEDRKEAIKLGVTLCTEGDILLVAGKGHEKYQEIHGERVEFKSHDGRLVPLTITRQ